MRKPQSLATFLTSDWECASPVRAHNIQAHSEQTDKPT
eukprot:COSAG02_NODE_55239_length_291_cov_1.380208_1_plen_37_part_10